MRADPEDRRWRWSLLALAGAVLALCLSGAFVRIVRYRGAADYPGAMLVSDHSVYTPGPYPSIRRDTSYRTLDPFPKVYNWYSSGFGLGPEARAHSGCILMADAGTSLRLVERQMSVMLCDTPKGRMIFVMRSLALHYRP